MRVTLAAAVNEDLDWKEFYLNLLRATRATVVRQALSG